MTRTSMGVLALGGIVAAAALGCERDSAPSAVPPSSLLRPNGQIPPPPPAPPPVRRMYNVLKDPPGDSKEPGRGDLQEATAFLRGGDIEITIKSYGLPDKSLIYRLWITSNKHQRSPIEVLCTPVNGSIHLQLGASIVAQIKDGVSITDVIRITVPLEKLPPGYSDATSWFVTGVESLQHVVRDNGTSEMVRFDFIEGGISVAR